MNLSSFSAKVLVTSLLVLSTTGLAFAKGYGYKGENYKAEVPCPPPVMLRDGFYLGAQVGYDSYRVREDVYFVPPSFNLFDSDPVINATGWLGGLFLGYGRYLTDLFYLGGEVYGNYSSASGDWSALTKSRNFYYKNDFDVRGSWGLNLIPGLRLNDTTLGYIKIGYNWARFNSDETVYGLGKFDDDHNTEHGWSAGLGLETLLWDEWSVRTEYNHICYDDFHSNLGTEFNPSDNQFTVGLVYHFA